MNGFKISLDDVQYTSKPESKIEKAMISNRIGGQIEEITTKRHLFSCLTSIGVKGQTFCPATFTNGKRSTENFEQIQVFVLDFDETIRMSKIYDRTDQYNLPILFAYETFSSEDCNRFRVAFLNDVPITDIRAAQVIQNALMTIFPEADKGCKNVVQMYYGGKGLLYTNEYIPTKEKLPRMNIESLFRNMALFLRNKYGDTHYKRKITEFSQANKIKLNDKGLPDVVVEEKFAEDVGRYNDEVNNGKILPQSKLYAIDEVGRNLPNKSIKNYRINFEDNPLSSSLPTNSLGENSTPNYHRPYRSGDLVGVRSRCRLFNEFESGGKKLNHKELFGLLTNLVQVESGANLFKRRLRDNSYFEDNPKKYDDWDYYARYVKDYKPYSCDGYCPYKNECTHGTNLLSTAKVKRRQMEKLSGHFEEYVSMAVAEEDFRRRFRYALYADKKMVYAIKAQVGLGKTQTLIEELMDATSREPTLRVLIAVPTNKLKKEIQERAEVLGLEIVESPSLRELKDMLPDDVWDRIEKLYDSGRSVVPFIKKKVAENAPEYSSLLKEYLRDLDAFYNFDGQAITTHKRLLTMDFSKYDLVIIDEDFMFNSIIPNKVDVIISALKRIRNKLRNRIAPVSATLEKIDRIIGHSKTCKKEYELFELPEVDCDISEDDMPMGVDISSLCTATDFVYRKVSGSEDGQNGDRVSYFLQDRFKDSIKDTKIIMMSATANKEICEDYFGKKNVDYYECKKARNLGTLNHYHDRSFSRSDIAKDVTVLTKIKNWSGFKHTICFKTSMHMFSGDGDLNFGGTAGLDHLKGQNIDVIGVYHQPEWVYKLFARHLGLTFDENARLKTCTVEHNGYRFQFMTFDDEKLRAIQFYIIESELEQAVGRARLLRCDCIVNLYGNFPLSHSILKESEYDTAIAG